METRLDSKKARVTSKARKSEAAGLKRKVTAPTFDKQATTVIRKRELPQLTPLHRLQRFKAIRDKNLKSKGFKTSLENRLKKMEEVTTATTTTIEIKEKLTIKETLMEEVESYDTTKYEESAKVLENGNREQNGYDEKNNGFSKEAEDSFLSIEESIKEKFGGNEKLEEEEQLEAKNEESLNDLESVEAKDLEPVEESIIESNINSEEVNKVNLESISESEAVSSICSQQAVSNSTRVETDDEEVEIVQSKSEYESCSKENGSGTSKKENAGNSQISSETVNSSNKVLSNSSVASSYRSSYNNLSKIYGRRPVRRLAGSRKRKLEEESVKNCDFKRTNSPSQPSPSWRFIPTSMNFWTPRTTPFIFPASTPMRSLNDSLTVNVNDDTLRNHLEDSELFSDAEELKSSPPIKSRWGCAVM